MPYNVLIIFFFLFFFWFSAILIFSKLIFFQILLCLSNRLLYSVLPITVANELRHQRPVAPKRYVFFRMISLTIINLQWKIIKKEKGTMNHPNGDNQFWMERKTNVKTKVITTFIMLSIILMGFFIKVVYQSTLVTVWLSLAHFDGISIISIFLFLISYPYIAPFNS